MQEYRKSSFNPLPLGGGVVLFQQTQLKEAGELIEAGSLFERGGGVFNLALSHYDSWLLMWHKETNWDPWF